MLVMVAAGAALAVVGLGALFARRRSDAGQAGFLAELPGALVTAFDANLRLQSVAGPELERLRRDARELVGLTLWEAFPPEEANALAAHYEAAIRGERRSFRYRSASSGREYAVRVGPAGSRRGLAVAVAVDDAHPGESTGASAGVGAVVEATRALARSTDVTGARRAVCEGARQVAEAPIAVLFEPASVGGGLEATAAVGTRLRDFRLPLSSEDSGAARALLRAEETFVTAESSDPVDRAFMERSRAVAVLWHPVLRDRAAIGVLAIAWREPHAGISARLSGLIDLLGAEAAVAIGRAELLARLEQLTLTDELTGLPNRRAWEQELPRELARAWRDGRPLCVAMLDLDHFKDFNDTHGHQVGDELLQEAAEAWGSVLRRYDTLARYGGEEFSIILPGCPLDEAVPLIERLRSVTPKKQSCSVGIAEWDGREDPSALLGRADAALYRAKRSGRDRAVSARSPSSPRPGSRRE